MRCTNPAEVQIVQCVLQCLTVRVAVSHSVCCSVSQCVLQCLTVCVAVDFVCVAVHLAVDCD